MSNNTNINAVQSSQVTVPTGTEGEKVTVIVSKNQVAALQSDAYENLEEAKGVIGKQALQVLRPLVIKGLFDHSTRGKFKITALGKKVRKVLAERV